MQEISWGGTEIAPSYLKRDALDVNPHCICRDSSHLGGIKAASAKNSVCHFGLAGLIVDLTEKPGGLTPLSRKYLLGQAPTLPGA